jgi:two-component system nitrogen regulation sensor histidine kinase NtrY
MRERAMRDQGVVNQQPPDDEGGATGWKSNLVIGGLVVFAIILFLLTARFISTFTGENLNSFIIILAISTILIAVLSFVVLGRLFKVWQNRRVGLAGSRMHIRLVGILSLVTLVATIIAFVFSAAILQMFSDEFFVERVDKANSVARQMANTYFNGQSRDMALSITDLAIDLNRFEQANIGIEADAEGINQYLLGRRLLMGWEAIYVLDGQRNIIARAEAEPDNPPALPAAEVFDLVDQGTDANGLFEFNAQDPETLSLYQGTLKIQLYGGGYLVAYKRENPIMSNQLLDVRNFRDDTRRFRERLGEMRGAFTLAFSLLAAIILLLAVWVGMMVAQNIVSPIGRLASAAGKISEGDLTERVTIKSGDGELGELAAIFNGMTEQLETQRDDLISANQQSDQRRRFIEAVLSRVSAGVVGVSSDGRITIVNTSAAGFFGMSSGKLLNSFLTKVSPELESLFNQARNSPTFDAQGEVEVLRGGQTRTLNVRIGGSKTEDIVSYVVTFDDITDLISAQRNAAWGDVARRIAHEIKNPLTPIQLSAERLRRKYSDEITSNREVFDRCTDTIIKHVNDIGRMVTEFSSFARMPEPVMATESLREIAKSAVFPFQVAHTNIEFNIDAPQVDVTVKCDGRLLVQACTNLIKNACEAIEEGPQGVKGDKGKITISISEDEVNAFIDVIDNGKGLPEDTRHRLTEPYMTTREKGTGLGLAIVRKVIEEHAGTLSMQNDTSLGDTGARVRLALPKQTSKKPSLSVVTDNDNIAEKQESA